MQNWRYSLTLSYYRPQVGGQLHTILMLGQTCRQLQIRFLEHHRYNKTNNPQRAYASHILDYQHKYGTVHVAMKIITSTHKGPCMNYLKNLQIYREYGMLLIEQNVGEFNSLYEVNCNTQARNKDISWTTCYLLKSRLITEIFGTMPRVYTLSLTITRI